MLAALTKSASRRSRRVSPSCGNAAGGFFSSAWVEARGRGRDEASLAIVTRYTLRAGGRALFLETILTNMADPPIVLLSLGDAIQWGSAEKIAPGNSVGPTGVTTGPFVGVVGRYASYAVTGTDGTIEATRGDLWTQTLQSKEVSIARGESQSYARVFVVGQRSDTANGVADLARLSCEQLDEARQGRCSSPHQAR